MKSVTRIHWFPVPAEQVYDLFCDPRNLNRCTPPWFHIRITTLPNTIETGAVIKYTMGMPLFVTPWHSEIVLADPPKQLIYRQKKGPYQLWEHDHRFEPQTRNGRAGTLMTDRVTYHLRPGTRWAGTIVHRAVEHIFEHRIRFGDHHLRVKDSHVPTLTHP